MKLFLKIFATFAVIFLFLTANIFAQKTKTPSDEKTPATPKVIKVDDITIKEILKPNGKPLLVNFWATWCVPCREEFPELVELDKEYKDKIDFITISLDDLVEINRDVPKFLKEMNATMPAYLLRTNDENAVIGSISKDWAGGLPFTVLYSEKSDVIYTRQGKIKAAVVKEKIDGLLVNKEVISELPLNSGLYPNNKYNYEKGIEDAKRDIANGRFIIKRYGLTPGISEVSRKKLKENHNIEYKEYGCVVTPNLVEYIKGYNKISRVAIEQKFGKDL